MLSVLVLTDRFVFNLRASYRQELAGLVDHFVRIGRKKIAVFYQVDAYGRSGWDGVRRALEKYTLKIVGEATYRRGASYPQSFHEQAAILRAANPYDLGIDAPVSFGPDKHQGLDTVYYVTAQEGRFVPITDWTTWAK